jgi:hemolysin activation/secretion protein
VNRPEGGETRSYTVVRGSVRRNYAFNPELTFSGSLNWQHAELTLLPASEQIQLGGDGSVRGYEPGVFAGDKGFVMNLELQRRLSLPSESNWKAAMLAFVDHGEVQPFRPANSPRSVETLTSAGVGASLSWRERVQARLTIGSPVSRPPEVSNAMRAHFQVVWSLL